VADVPVQIRALIMTRSADSEAGGAGEAVPPADVLAQPSMQLAPSSRTAVAATIKVRLLSTHTSTGLGTGIDMV